MEKAISHLITSPFFFLLFLFWALFWKGWALWKAAQKKQLLWFILLLVFNTLGFLEIFYIFYLNRWDLDNGRLLKFLAKIFKKKEKNLSSQ